MSINFLLIGLTGVVLIWRHELAPASVFKEKTSYISEKSSLSKIEKFLKTNFEGKKILSIFKGDDGDIQARVTSLGVKKFKGATRLKFDRAGNHIASENVETKTSNLLIDFILKLHRELLLGGKGKVLIGFMGLFFLIAIISGALISSSFYRNNIKKRNSRILLGQLHKVIGVKSCAWLLIVTFSGTILAFNSTLIGLFLRDNISSQHNNTFFVESSHFVSVLDIYEELKQKVPNFEYDFISFPNNEFSIPNHFVVLMESKDHNHEIAYINAISGDLIKRVTLPWYLELLVLSEPLHFGNYGGPILKVIWSLFGIMVAFIPISGVYIFLFRKRFLKISLTHYNKIFFDDSTTFLCEILLPTVFIFAIFLVSNEYKWPLSLIFIVYLGMSWKSIIIFLLGLKRRVSKEKFS